MNFLSNTEAQEKEEMEIRDREGQEVEKLKEEKIKGALKKMKNKNGYK